MPEFSILPATAAHVRTVAQRMRAADREEVMAASGRTPVQALTFSIRRSTVSRVWLVDDRPEAIFGVADINVLAGVAAPWLLGTDEIESHPVAFLRQSIAWRDQLLRRYSKLINFVDARHVASIEWLRWLGFRVGNPVLMRGHPFRIFELGSEDVRHHHGAIGRRHSARSNRQNFGSAIDGGGREV